MAAASPFTALRACLAAALASAALAAPAAPAQDGPAARGPAIPPVIRMGLSSYARPANHTAIIAPTVEALEKALAPSRLVVTEYSIPGLEKAIRAGEVDIFQSSAGFYWRQRDAGVRALVTAASVILPDPNRNDGTVIVVNKERDDIRGLADLKGKRLAANLATGFTGYQVPMAEIAAQGFDPDGFFSGTVFTGENAHMADIFRLLREGKADAGFLRLCYLERFPEEARRLKVINRKASDLACVHSTDLYPTWTISATREATHATARAVAAALLAMPETDLGLYWSVASDYSGVDLVYKRLRLGPYAYLRSWTVRRFLEEYWSLLALALACVAGLALHAARVSQLHARKDRELKAALAQQAELLNKSKEASAKIDSLQRAGAVGLLSSMVAHELNQPLGALVCYARGLLRKAEQGQARGLEPVFEDIAAQAKRAYDIVARVRGYAKGESGRREVDLSALVAQALDAFELSGRCKAAVEREIAPGVRLQADPVEAELIVLNLVKNASDALAAVPGGRIQVRLAAAGDAALLTVEDNGPAADEALLARLAQPLASTKADGLGLGLPIVRSIIESMGGRLDFSLKADGAPGLAAAVRLPLKLPGLQGDCA
ncbi:MAG: PhnD/SsuA/transferrin family substrate-binding protein [Duodenibacillus sp.]|nr:PhnD/SsuA/transferrin family substrate-binding protein [Duodenibacillus sp.]